MASLAPIARPYAKAAFEYAKEQRALDTWSAQLKLLANTVTNAEVASLIRNPSLGEMVVADAILQVAAGKLDAHVVNFVRVLAAAHRLTLLPSISEAYEVLLLIEQKTVMATLVSAFPVSEAQQAKIAAALAKRLGREIKLSCQIDKNLIGGAIIHAGDWVLDGSLRGKLQRMSHELMA